MVEKAKNSPRNIRIGWARDNSATTSWDTYLRVKRRSHPACFMIEHPRIPTSKPNLLLLRPAFCACQIIVHGGCASQDFSGLADGLQKRDRQE